MEPKQIAEDLKEEAEWLEDEPGTGTEERFEKKFGSLTVRCSPSKPAVEAMAEKFKKNKSCLTKNVKLKKHSQVRRYDKRVYEKFVLDDEPMNAIQYNLLFDKDAMFSAGRDKNPNLLIIKGEVVREGFVVGHVVENGKPLMWDVYHLDTGMACSSLSSDKKGAVMKFNRIKEEDLQQAIENSKDRFGFQQRALKNALK